MPHADIEAKKAYQRSYIARADVKSRRRKTYAAWSKKNSERLKAEGATRRLEKRAMVMIATVRVRARKRGLAFDLDEHTADIQRRIDRNSCEVTGLPFDLSPGRKFNSPSIDRIDPRKGYTHDNIRVVLNLVNAAMGDWGADVLRGVMEAWLGGPSSRKSRPKS